MKNILTFVFVLLLPMAATAEPPASAEAAVREAVKAFNDAYAHNEVADYFGWYADDASLYFYGARQTVQAYRDEWAAMIAAGGGVEKNELSDIRVRVMPGGDVALASYFVDYRMRSPNGDISASKAFESDVWQHIDGDWRIVSLHYSEFTPAQ